MAGKRQTNALWLGVWQFSFPIPYSYHLAVPNLVVELQSSRRVEAVELVEPPINEQEQNFIHVGHYGVRVPCAVVILCSGGGSSGGAGRTCWAVVDWRCPTAYGDWESIIVNRQSAQRCIEADSLYRKRIELLRK